MNWLERIAKYERKHRLTTIKRNVRAYRQRQSAAAIRRIEIALTTEQFDQLMQFRQAEETYSQSIGRLLQAISGNRELVKKAE